MLKKREISAKKNNIIGLTLDLNEKKSKLIIDDANAKSSMSFGKVRVTHIGPDVKDIKVGEVVYVSPGLVQGVNYLEGVEDCGLMTVFPESAVYYSVTE